jgi:hypothetical protein
MILNRILKVANFELNSHKIWPELTRITHLLNKGSDQSSTEISQM